MAQQEYTIGIGVTTQNRPDTFKEFLKNIKKYMPKNAKLVIVDDASTIPVKEATYRFEQVAGIARSKNKCLELLRDCKHIFLFDDDCWPQKNGWWKPYVESREPHFSYIFQHFVHQQLNDCDILYTNREFTAYSHPRGCMLYFDSICLDVIGGYDTTYRRWGYEHVDISNRIYNAGLTLFRYMDITGSAEYIHSEDEHQRVPSTVSMEERRPYLIEMKQKFEDSFTSKAYHPFVEPETESVSANTDIVLTSYFTSQIDPQRNIKWEADLSAIQDLIDSMNGQKLVILHDCFEDGIKVPDNVEMIKVETSMNPYFQRWLSEYEYMRDHPELRFIFHVDATDVQMVRNPFKEMIGGTLYVGSEETNLNTTWMIHHHRIPFLLQFFRRNGKERLLNCGLVGADRRTMMEFFRAMNTKYFDEKGKVGPFEMGLFNWVCREKFNDRIKTGSQVHTKFKTYDYESRESWWRHK